MKDLNLGAEEPLTRARYTQFSVAITAERDPSLRWLKVAVLGSFTTDFLKPYLVVESARHHLGLDLWLAPFGQIEQQALDTGSELYRQNAEVFLILPRLEDLAPEICFRFLAHKPEALGEARKNLATRIEAVIKSIRQQSGGHILMGNFTPPTRCAAGLAESSLELSQAGFVQRLNEDLAGICRHVPNVAVLDVARAATETGLDRWRDDKLFFMAKAPLSADAMTALAKATARRLRACFQVPKKCLVLDMDNTLWGGVLGEAGVEGIALGPDYPGNVFVEFQRQVLMLRDRGIILAAASKNNASDVEAVLAQHPSSILKREHFAAFEVHWEDKATSLRRIAATLNIGRDALVFFDDNPVERAWVREQLPEVTVVEVPANAMGYVAALENCFCFDSGVLTEEDRQRAELYQSESARQSLSSQIGSIEDFLAGLGMTLSVGSVDAATLPRFVQLLEKTNQFNLTTRRHTSAQVSEMLAQGGIGLWARLRDRFGDSGIIAAALVVPTGGDAWSIDTFLMSCRVLGRRVETAMLAFIEREVRERGGRTLTGEFIPTAKNQPAADFLPQHGFAVDAADSTRWHLAPTEPRAIPSCFEIEDLTRPQ